MTSMDASMRHGIGCNYSTSKNLEFAWPYQKKEVSVDNFADRRHLLLIWDCFWRSVEEVRQTLVKGIGCLNGILGSKLFFINALRENFNKVHFRRNAQHLESEGIVEVR